jgi:hypothetical protein
MPTIEITDEQLATHERGETITIPGKWKCGGGIFHIAGHGRGDKYTSDGYREYGHAYKTRELAEKAARLERPRNLLLHYILEHAPEHDPDGPGWILAIHETVRWSCYYTENLVKIHLTMPGQIAHELADRLNDGTVDFWSED